MQSHQLKRFKTDMILIIPKVLIYKCLKTLDVTGSFLLYFHPYSSSSGFPSTVRRKASLPSFNERLHCHETVHIFRTSWSPNLGENVCPSLKIYLWGEVKWSEVTQSCLTLCDPMDCSLPGSSIHGIFQARVPEWVAIAFSSTSGVAASK